MIDAGWLVYPGPEAIDNPVVGASPCKEKKK